MKKTILASIATLAMVAAISPVMASYHKPMISSRFDNKCCDQKQTCCPELTVNTNNNAVLNNYVVAVSNTGLNAIKGDNVSMPTYGFNNYHPAPTGDASITTGAATAVNGVSNEAVAQVDVKLPTSGKVTVNTSNTANVMNKVGAVANTGANLVVKSGKITTGAAGSQNSVGNVVDSAVNVY